MLPGVERTFVTVDFWLEGVHCFEFVKGTCTLKLSYLFVLALAFTTYGSAQSTPAERGQDLAIGRKAAASTVTKSEEVYLQNNILFELSDTGWTGLNLGRSRLLHSMGWWPRYLNEYAKRTGVADVAAMEDAYNFDGAAEAAQALKGKVTIHLKDDNVKWTQAKAEQFVSYAGTVVEFIGDSYGYTPKNGVYHVTLLFTPKVNDIAVFYNKSDGSFIIKAPSELSPNEWDSKMKAGLLKGGAFRY